jgi:hypothetical protein
MPTYFAGSEPADVAQPVGFVEVEDEVGRGVQRGRAVGELDGAPWRLERQRAFHLPAFRGGRELGAEAAALGAAQPHARIVDQRGLVEGDMQAVIGAHGHRRVRAGDLLDRGALVEVLVAVPFAGRDPPGGGGFGERELGQLLVDDRLGHRRLLGEGVAEADAVVEHPEHQVEHAVRDDGLTDGRAQLLVVVAHEAVLAPGLLPGLIVAAPRLRGEREVSVERAAAAQAEAEAGVVDDLLAEAQHAVGQAAFVQVELHGQDLVRRGHRGDGLGARHGQGQGRGKQDEGGQSHAAGLLPGHVSR